MRILVVEDEKEIAQFLKVGLESEYFIVDIAEEGNQGLFLAQTNDYDLLILDNILPQKTGLQICRELRTNGNTIPILVLSIKSTMTTKVEFLNVGADDYLSKPFSFQELLARVNAILRRPLQNKNQVLTIGKLALDSSKHIVTYNAKEITLTRREFLLLECLMRNYPNVVSRGMIIETVWDMGINSFSNTIESHILSLRRKIDSLNKVKIIHTIPGIGYVIDVRNS